MPTTESNLYISPLLVEAVRTDVDTESPLTNGHSRDDQLAGDWQSLIDHKLIEWGRDPSQLDDEGVESPTGETIQLTIKLAQSLRDAGLAPPDSVVPDPNGGMVFERRESDVSEVFHVWNDGSVEYSCFQGTRLVERWTL